MLRFIDRAGKNDTLLCCFYEFHYEPVLKALAAARKKIKSLRIIIDAKVNEYTDKKGKFYESFPRVVNTKAYKAAGIPDANIIKRDRNPADIQHNKFMVLLKGASQKPVEVWTGSTNLSLGGVSGQTNVGHWVRDANVTARFKAYWDVLAANPGSAKGDSATAARKGKAACRDAVEALGPPPASLDKIAKGTSVVFSPRAALDPLDLYVSLVDEADSLACITLAFGVNDLFKNQLKNNTNQNHLTFLLLEQKDNAAKKDVAHSPVIAALESGTDLGTRALLGKRKSVLLARHARARAQAPSFCLAPARTLAPGT